MSIPPFANAVPTRVSLGIDAGAIFITSGTTYTTPSGITTNTLFKFTLIAGGGGGGGINTAAQGAAAGGGGAVGILFVAGLTPSTAYTITIGVGGNGGAGTGATAGSNGTATKLIIGATTYTANPGIGAPALSGNTDGGAGGTVSGFTINLPGGKGGCTQGGATGAPSGAGGDAIGWGVSGEQVIAGAGIAGIGYGAGGSGGHGASAAGGKGGNGCILVEYHN